MSNNPILRTPESYLDEVAREKIRDYSGFYWYYGAQKVHEIFIEAMRRYKDAGERYQSPETILNSISKVKNIPLDRLIIGFVGNDLYVWDYDEGRSTDEFFKVVEIIPHSLNAPTP